VEKNDTSFILNIAHRFNLNAEMVESFLLYSIVCKFKNRNTKPAELLISLGARPTGKDLGITAQYVELREVHRNFLHILLLAGAKVDEPYLDERTGKETTAFRYSLGTSPYITNLFMKYGGRISSHDDIREMVMEGNLSLLDKAVREGWDPLVRHNGFTHLEALFCNMFCDSGFFTESVQWLVDHGASLTQRTPEGGPLISYLLYQKAMRAFPFTKFITWLLDHGAAETIEREDQYGDSPLSIAVAGNAEDIIRLLLDRGVKPDSGNAMKKAKGEMEYHPDSLILIRPVAPISERTLSILRGEKVEGPAEIYSRGAMNYR
jgi:ankyrin repeat protein